MQSKFDVIIVGAGPAGIAAAIIAARNGASVLLVEKSGFVGGLTRWTSVWKGTASSDLFEKIRGCSTRAYSYLLYDNQKVADLYQKELKEVNVNILLQATLFDVKVNEKKISNIKVLTTDGIKKFKAKVFVDCTGTGRLNNLAGGESIIGKRNSASLIIRLGGIDSKAVDCFDSNAWEEIQNYQLPEPINTIEVLPAPRLGVCTVILTCKVKSKHNSTKVDRILRGQVGKLLQFMQDYMTGFRNCYVQNISEYAVHKTTPIVKCDFTLSEEHITSGKIFDDWAVSRAYAHMGHLEEVNESFFAMTQNLRKTHPYTIPYGTLCAKSFSNLLVAGRCISATPKALSSANAGPICIAMGQAAGTAAAIAALDGNNIRNIKITKLQSKLLTQGVERPKILKVSDQISPSIGEVLPPEDDMIPTVPDDAGQALSIQVKGLDEDFIEDLIEDA